MTLPERLRELTIAFGIARAESGIRTGTKRVHRSLERLSFWMTQQDSTVDGDEIADRFRENEAIGAAKADRRW